MLDPLQFPVPALLETQRLILRPFRVGNAPALHAALTEPLRALRSHLWFLPWVAEAPTLHWALPKTEVGYRVRTSECGKG
jgi:hypothetical protein